MLDIRLIRERTDFVKSELAKVGFEATAIDALLASDVRRRGLIQEVESLRAKRAEVSRTIGKQDPSARAQLVVDMRAVGDRIASLEQELAAAETAVERQMLEVPNLPDASVPVGRDDRDNTVLRSEGEPRQFDFSPRPHWDIAPELDILDFDRGVKIAGSRFYILKAAGARLQRALITWMLDLHTRQHGYTEIYPPYLVKKECLYGAGQLPKFADNIYYDTEDDLWMIGTAEVPVTNLHRDEILEASALPLSYVAYTACFRREKMSAGRDVRGIKRGHQFDKVEMYKIVAPADSNAALEQIVSDAEDVARGLGIPHRVISICTGDLGFVAAKKYDIELWAPGCNEWLEVSSCSNCTDFQARRTNIRYRPAPRGKPEFVHTLNGSGLALPRVLIAVLENYQQADGSVVIPEVLRPYMGMDRLVPPN
ncbi:MAG TPA: serine--tRNA ligase [Candidatus Margulisiibacteriota bacterium]|nr:serine--tRNA ligase [Candidatus Margulisiibacteriota bacterium]